MGNKAFILIFISGLSTGSVYPLIKIAETYDIPRFSYIFWESLIIITILSAIALFKNERQLFKVTALRYYVFCAVTNIIIPQNLSFMIAPNVPANILSIITVLTPILVYIVSIIFLKEKRHLHKAVGIVLGLVGILILFAPSLFMESYVVSWFWLGMALLIPIDYTVNRIYASKLIPKNDSPYSLAIGLFSLTAIISGLVMVSSGSFYRPWEAFTYGDLALLLHGILMAFFYLIFFILAKTCSLQNSLSFYVAPLVGMGWGYLAFNESFSFSFVLASFLVFMGLYLVTKKIETF